MVKEMMPVEEAELYLKVLEQDMRRAKESLLKLEFLVPGLTEDQKRTVSETMRQTMAELAKERLPLELREQIPPALADRVDDLFKLWEPEEQ